MSSEKVHIVPYTISKLRQSLKENDMPHELMPKIRQISYIHNPCVSDDTVVLVVAKSPDGALIGYMGVFPEQLQKPNTYISWGITLYIDSQYRGKGYGDILNAEIMKYAKGLYLVINHVPATARILEKKGYEELFYDKYQLYVSRWNEHKGRYLSLKSVANQIDKCVFKRHSTKIHLLNDIEFEYVKSIDDETYRFITEHSADDMFVRSRDILNWILQYPFTIETPLVNKTNRKYYFSCSYKTNALYAVKIYFKQELVGFLILRNRDGNLTLLYRYFKDAYREYVYATVTEHINALKPQTFTTTDSVLTDFLKQQLKPVRVLNSKFRLSFPKQFLEIDVENGYIQGGDGDMFI